jgi:hypothetical protein
MAVFTFLKAYNFSGKTKYPLVTHGSSRFGRSLDDKKTYVQELLSAKGLISDFDRNPNDDPRVTVPNRDVTNWLRKIGF